MATSQPSRSILSYRDLVAWQQAMELVLDVYRSTRLFPDYERFGLMAQIRRSAVSVPSNIAEGQGCTSRGEFKQFLGHARGSLAEVETQVLIADRLGYFSEEQSKQLSAPLFGSRSSVERSD